MRLPCRASADTGTNSSTGDRGLATGASRQRFSALATRRRVARPSPVTPQPTKEPRAPKQPIGTASEQIPTVVPIQDLKPPEPESGPIVVRSKPVNVGRGLRKQQGIGSYAAKLQTAQIKGRSATPSEVNPLHPLKAAERVAEGLPPVQRESEQHSRAGTAAGEDADEDGEGVPTDEDREMDEPTFEDFEDEEDKQAWTLGASLELELATREDSLEGTGYQPQATQSSASTSESNYNFGLPRGGLKDWRMMSRPSQLTDAPLGREGNTQPGDMGPANEGSAEPRGEGTSTPGEASAGHRRGLQDIVERRKAKAGSAGNGADERFAAPFASASIGGVRDQAQLKDAGTRAQDHAETTTTVGNGEQERVIPKVKSWRHGRLQGVNQSHGGVSPGSEEVQGDEASSSGSSLKERLGRLRGADNESLQPSYGNSFFKAAAALQARLTLGVKAEVQAAIDAQERVYRRRSIEQLRKAGVVITDLVGQQTDTIFSDFIWTFTLAPELPAARGPDDLSKEAVSAVVASSSDDEAAAEGADGPATQLTLRDLPEHGFKKGESVVLLPSRPSRRRRSYFEEEEDEGDTPQGNVLEVRRNFIRVAVARDVSERLWDAGPEARWRLDKILEETTADRQLQAISMLDKPFAHVEKLKNFEGELAIMDEEQPTMIELQKMEYERILERDEAERSRGIISKEFRAGELQVRKILLGDPNSADVAAVPPTWASSKEWRLNAKQWLTELGVKDEGYKLNGSQLTAIAKTLSSTLSLWQGPPGTGKTRTLLVLLHVLCKLSDASVSSSNPMGPILACADTNAATDNILAGLLDRGVDVVRIGRPVKVREGLRHATLEDRALNTPQGQMATELREKAERVYAERRAGGGLNKALVSKYEWDKRQRQLFQEGKDLEKQARALLRKAQQLVLDSCQIVTATCSGAGDVAALQNRRFRVVVLDEATQSTEPSTLIPLLRGAESVVMAGDPKQLPPTVISERGMQCDLDVTLFERLQVTGVKPYLLDTQYRMHPGIATFPNDLFYAGKLKSGITAADRPAPAGFPWPNPDCPVALIECNESQESRASSMKGSQVVLTDQSTILAGSSYCNLNEARLAVRAFEMLMSAKDAESGAILTPYNGQVKLIRNLLKETNEEKREQKQGGERRKKEKREVTVSTVDGYQGREADIIVFSAVRNNEEGRLGFVTDPRRLNVAITRPRRGLVVVGSNYTLSADPRWNKWLAWVRDRGGFLSPEALLLTPEEKLSGAFDPQVVVAEERRDANSYAAAELDTEEDLLIDEEGGYMAEFATEAGLPNKENANLNQGWNQYGMSDDNSTSVAGDGAVTWGNDWYG